MSTPVPALTGQDIGETEGAVRGLLEEVLSGTDCTADQYIVLRVLTLRSSMSRPELEALLYSQRQLRLDPDEASALLDGMARAGLITPDSPTQPTERGARLYLTLADAVREVTTRLYAGLDPADLTIAKAVLRQLAERATTLRAEVADQHAMVGTA